MRLNCTKTDETFLNFIHCQISGSDALQPPDTGYPANRYIQPDTGSDIRDSPQHIPVILNLQTARFSIKLAVNTYIKINRKITVVYS